MNGTSAMRHTNWPRLAVLAGAALAMALFLGWQSGEMSVTPDPPAPKVKWALPLSADVDTAKDLAVLTERKPWGSGAGLLGEGGGVAADGPGAKQAAEDSQWRLAGVIARPDERLALIAVGKPGATKYEYRAIGEKMPDGSTLVDISTESATTRVNGSDDQQRVHWLFRDEPPVIAPAPPASGAAPATSPAVAPSNRRADAATHRGVGQGRR